MIKPFGYINDEVAAMFKEGGSGDTRLTTAGGGTYNTPVYLHPPARIRPRSVEDVARHLFEHDVETKQLDTRWAYHWPQDDNDDGYRGDGGYVTILPEYLLIRYRERAKAVLAYIEAGQPTRESAHNQPIDISGNQSS